jgi:beta-lactamase class D
MRLFLLIITACFLFACTPNNITINDDLAAHFEKENVKGCFGIMNNANGKFTIYNLDRYRDSAYSPASTFKIINSLIGLQTGVISSDSMIIKWDGVERWNADWNRDLNMFDAFRSSAVPYYQEVARRIGLEKMKTWLDSLGYGLDAASYAGNADIKNRQRKISTIDSFWLNGELLITPDEQLGLAKRLYFNQLPFFKLNHDIVKNAMLFEDKPEYKLSYKTGWRYDSTAGLHTGWVVGWIEENNHPYFFVLNLESPNRDFDMVNSRMRLLKSILSDLGYMKGRM